MKLKLFKIYEKNGENTKEVAKTNIYHSNFDTIVMFITISCFWRWFGIFPTQIDFTTPIFSYDFKMLEIIYRNKNRKNAEEVCKTNLYHSSFDTIVMFITIPFFWR